MILQCLQKLRKMLLLGWEQCSRNCGKLQPSKCELLKTSLLYLDHVVSEDGIRTDPKKIEAVLQWPIPVTVTDVRSFIGLTNYTGGS